jgi:hypothetical protein
MLACSPTDSSPRRLVRGHAQRGGGGAPGRLQRPGSEPGRLAPPAAPRGERGDQRGACQARGRSGCQGGGPDRAHPSIAFSQPGATWKSGDVLKACELLGRHLRVFEDEVSVGLTLEDLVPSRQNHPLIGVDASPPAAAVEAPKAVVSLDELVPVRSREPKTAEMEFDPLRHLRS